VNSRADHRVRVAKLSRTSIDTDQPQAFFAWRRDSANRCAWNAVEAGRKRVDRFEATGHRAQWGDLGRCTPLDLAPEQRALIVAASLTGSLTDIKAGSRTDDHTLRPIW